MSKKLDLTDFGIETVVVAKEETTVVIEAPYELGPRVPNKQPRLNGFTYRIAIIGDAPSKDEEYVKEPFAGMSGRFLTALMSKASIIRDAVFLGNICQYRPSNNDIDNFSFNGAEIQDGLSLLEKDLQQHNPNICVLLGKTALYAAKNITNIGDWRGSLFISDVPGPFYGRKCIASYHPTACLRQYEWTPILVMDLKKARKEGESKELILPQREIILNLTAEEIAERLNNAQYIKIGTDIEGYWNNISCMSVATSPTSSFIIPFTKRDGSSYWPTDDEEFIVVRALAKALANPSIPKIWQNGLYDRFCFHYGYDLMVFGNVDDTMLKFWEQYCELEKSLGFQASILTNEPYYKSDRKTDDGETFFRYCCKDALITYEISEKLEKILDAGQKTHYRFNHDLLNPLLYMELRGIKYDTKLSKQRLKEVNLQIYTLQADLDTIANVGFGKHAVDKPRIMSLIRDAMCYKREQTRPKKEFEDAYNWCCKLLATTTPLIKQDIGRLNIEAGCSMNIKSKQFKSFLYDTLKLPKQYKKDPSTGTERLTCDYEALLKIQKKQPHDAVQVALDLGVLRTRSQMLEIHADPDGRIRCGYNIVGTETGRLSCYTSPTGSGYNLQTIPAENTLKPEGHSLRLGMRDLFVADKDCYLFQCDLSGADGWTVGAYMAMLGDPTMLDDLKAGLKPASVICYMLRHGNDSLNGKSRAEIKELLKEVKKEDFDYYLSKQGIWMTCYSGGPQKLANLCLINSEGKINLSLSEVKLFQQAVFNRYRVKRWHDWLGSYLKKNNSTLLSPNGFKRRFFGRENEILGQALAHIPQVITTWATNSAMYKLWTDSENRLENNKLRCEPLHQVHDSLNGQFKTIDTEWALPKIRYWFNNTIVVAGIQLTIPFAGEYGLDWSMSKQSKKGDI